MVAVVESMILTRTGLSGVRSDCKLVMDCVTPTLVGLPLCQVIFVIIFVGQCQHWCTGGSTIYVRHIRKGGGRHYTSMENISVEICKKGYVRLSRLGIYD